MAVHQTFTNDPSLAFLLGPARPGFSGTWFGSVSIWSGPIIGFSGAGNAVVEVPVSGIPGVTAVQAEIFGTRVYDDAGLAQVNVTKIEWSLPGSATILASFEFAAPVPFPLSISRFAGDYRFVDILQNGPTATQLFLDYFSGEDTLVGANAADIMRGGGAADLLDGAGGADSLFGDDGNDTFIYRNGDAAAGETIDGGIDLDRILAIGAAVTGDIGQAGNVDISNLLISGVEEVWTNGTEVMVTAAQLVPGGFQTFVGLNGARDMLTISNVNSGNLSTLGLLNWEAQDLIAVLGTAAADNITGTGGSDIFLGFASQDTFNGGGGDDRFLIVEGDLAPTDIFNGDGGNDTLQLDAQAVTSFDVGPKTDIRGMQLSSVEVLDIIKGQYIIDASMLAGTLYGTTGTPVPGTGTINRVIGNSTNTLSQSVLLEIRAGTAIAVDLRNTVFENWNDGFYIDKLIRIVASTQTRIVYAAPNEENWVNGSGAGQSIYVFGGAQEDTLFGSNYLDYVVGGASADFIYGLNGNDSLGGDAGADWIYGGIGNDTIAGGEGIDNLYGDEGDDTLNGGTGYDEMTGGTGSDQYLVDAVQDKVYEAALGGYDIVYATVNYILGAGQEVEVLTANGSSGTVAINLTGNNLAQEVHGNNAINVLNGGVDSVRDILVGYGGNDVYVINSSNDLISEFVGGGTSDRVQTSVTFALAADDDIELMQTTNAALTTAINLIGNGIAQSIYGNAGINILNSGVDNVRDNLVGYGGNDVYIVHTATDIIIESVGQGTNDRVQTSVSFTLAADDDIEMLQTTDARLSTAINLTGNGLVQTIYGNAGTNILNGGVDTARDTLVGYAGNDTYVINSTTDLIVEAAGGGIADRVQTSVSFTLAADDDIEIFGTANAAGVTALNLTGNALIQTITGNAGANIINGGLGNDTLTGLGGADNFLFNTALNAATNHDTITDFNVAADTIQLENAIFTALVTGGVLAASLFEDASIAGQSGSEVIIYDRANGDLYYDTNGAGTAGGLVLFADVANNTVLTAADFFVV